MKQHKTVSNTENTFSQVTYVTMVPRVGNETLRPLGFTMGECRQRDSCMKHTYKNTTCWTATAYDVTTGATTV